jgi:hypothetical protein
LKFNLYRAIAYIAETDKVDVKISMNLLICAGLSAILAVIFWTTKHFTVHNIFAVAFSIQVIIIIIMMMMMMMMIFFFRLFV